LSKAAACQLRILPRKIEEKSRISVRTFSDGRVNIGSKARASIGHNTKLGLLILGRMHMKVRKVTMVFLGLVLLALLQAPAVNAKDAVVRPLHISGVITFYYDGSIDDQGVATHIGNFTGAGTWYSGKYIAANGDELYWEVAELGTYTLNITGGTGRFENATGTYSFEWFPISESADGATFEYIGEDTITY
jgi:hypothetical protein